MSSVTRFYDEFEKRIKLSIHTYVPARVVRFYASPREADIEILFMTSDKEGNLDKYPLIEKAPVLDHVEDLLKGDVVFAAVSERALDNLQKVPFDPQFRRTHDLRDCVVIGSYKKGGL